MRLNNNENMKPLWPFFHEKVFFKFFFFLLWLYWQNSWRGNKKQEREGERHAAKGPRLQQGQSLCTWDACSTNWAKRRPPKKSNQARVSYIAGSDSGGRHLNVECHPQEHQCLHNLLLPITSHLLISSLVNFYLAIINNCSFLLFYHIFM